MSSVSLIVLAVSSSSNSSKSPISVQEAGVVVGPVTGSAGMSVKTPWMKSRSSAMLYSQKLEQNNWQRSIVPIVMNLLTPTIPFSCWKDLRDGLLPLVPLKFPFILSQPLPSVPESVNRLSLILRLSTLQSINAESSWDNTGLKINHSPLPPLLTAGENWSTNSTPGSLLLWLPRWWWWTSSWTSMFPCSSHCMLVLTQYPSSPGHTNKTWSSGSGIPLREVNKMEREILHLLELTILSRGRATAT